MIIKQKQINRKVLPNCARKKISLNCKRSNLNRCSNYTELACFQVHCFSKKNSSPKGNFIVPVQRLFCWHDYKNPCILTKEEKKNQTNQPLLLTSLQWLKKQQCLTACNYSTNRPQTFCMWSIQEIGVLCPQTKWHITWLLLQGAEIWPVRNRKWATHSILFSSHS